MALLDLFRPQPAWKHADPEVRAEAVRKLEPGHEDLLLELARGDVDARVRKAAVRRLHRLDSLIDVAQAESDGGVRQEALEVLLERALPSEEAPVEAVLMLLAEPRALTQLARQAARPELRTGAVERLSDARSLSSLARTAQDAHVRQRAIQKLSDPAALLEVALKSEHKAVAVAATERLADEAALREVVTKARQRAAARRAEARLLELAPASAPAPAPVATSSDEEDLRRWREAEEAERRRRELQEQVAQAEARALAVRTVLCERLETAWEGDLAARIEGAQAEWQALPEVAQPEIAALSLRFEQAVQACRARLANQAEREALRPQVEEIVARAEGLVAAEDVGAARKELGGLEKRLGELFQAGAGDAALQQRFSAAREGLRARSAEARAERAGREARNKARLEELCQALETLARAPQLMLKDADVRLRASKEALAEPGPLPRADREALLERLKAARAAVFPRFQEAREDADWRRFAAEGVRESLLTRLQALSAETNTDKLDRELREVDRLWRQAGPPKDPSEPQIAAFTALRNELRARADEALKLRAAEFEANAVRKLALCAQAEALRDSRDWKNTADALQKLQAEWKAVGPVAREQAQELWQRFRSACDAFFTRRKADLDGRKQVWTANLQKKQALIERVEALKASDQWDKAVAEVKRLQAEWREVGPVKPAQSEPVWRRFRGACDEFFARYKQRDDLAQQAALAEREGPVTELEALVPAGQPGDAPEDLAGRVRERVTRFREGKPLPREAAAALEARLVKARNALVAAWPAAFAGTDLDPEANRKGRDLLCERVEALLARSEAQPAPSAGSLAEQLRQALAQNALGGGAGLDARLQPAAEELRSLRGRWQRLGPVPGQAGEALEARFEAAATRLEAALKPTR